MREHIDLVAREKLVAGFGREQPPFAAHPHHNGAQAGKQLGQLPQGRVQCRAIGFEVDPQQMHAPLEEGLDIKGRGRRQALQRGLGDLSFGADDHVDGQVLGPVEVGIDRVQIGARAQARDLARHLKDRMRDLTGDHVHLVRMGRGDDQVGVARARAVQHVGVAGKAGHPLHVQRVGGAADQIGIAVDHRHVVAFPRKVSRDLPADLPGAANDDLHRLPSCRPNRAPFQVDALQAPCLCRARARRKRGVTCPSSCPRRCASRPPRQGISACGAARCAPSPRTARCG